MVIRKLILKEFRNYPQLSLEFPSGLVFLHGRNGQGKTNLVEALYLLTHLKSFRLSQLHPLIQQGSEFSQVEAWFSKKGVEHQARILILGNQRKVWLDQKNLVYSSEYVQNFVSLLFSPDQLASFKEYPSEKRAFYDRILILLDEVYLQKLKEFEGIRKNKNKLLKLKEKAQLSAWNQLLGDCLPLLIERRIALVQKINLLLQEEFTKITGRTESIQLHYHSDLAEKIALDKDSIICFFEEKKDSELQAGHMNYGPHKDSFWMTIDGKNDKQILSQGEQRAAFLAQLLAINRLIQEEKGFWPLLLLDDLFSELDQSVLKHSLNYLTQLQNQIFITSTEAPNPLWGKYHSLLVDHGTIAPLP